MNSKNNMVEIPVKDIRFANYQRKVNKQTISEIVNHFDPHRMRPVELSFRDGVLWCFDGEHRVLAYKKMDIATIPAQIHYELTYEDEAMLFAKQHENERRVSIRDRWNAGNAAGEKMQNYVEIKNIMEDRGYKLDPTFRDSGNTFTCIATIIKGHEKYGASGLKRVLDTIDAAWGNCAGRTNTNIVSALFRIYGCFGDSIDWDRLVKCLSKHTALSFVRDSREERGNGGARVARHMVNVYNTKLRKNKLNIDLIHS